MATPNFGSRVPQILSRIPHWGTGLLVLSLLGCATNLPPSSPPPEATEELKQTPELPDSPDATVPETNAVESSQGLTPVAIAPPLPQTELWSLLQQQEAPYFVLMRHALAPGTGDPATFQVDDCATQRNLSAEGRAQAAGTGDAFRPPSGEMVVMRLNDQNQLEVLGAIAAL
ncbi:MAG: hypothetical protein VKJ64_10970 [Leptolyngbyaceae bacterium]|nr:hypothetical protein [Leptolyngbyaceae bacterium]